MGPVNVIHVGLKKSFQFSGRATRSEFWWFAPLGLCLAAVIVTWSAPLLTLKPEMIFAICVFMLASFPVWAAASRRLRDNGENPKLVVALLILPFAHLGFAQLFFSGTVSGAGIFGLLFGIYYFGGFVILTFVNLALLLVILALCARSASIAPTPMRSPHD